MNHWQSPLGIATRHDKKRAKAEKLRKEADRIDAEADALYTQYTAMKQKYLEQLAAEGIHLEDGF